MSSNPQPDPAVLRGIELFNQGKFWHAHEAWEELWLVAEPGMRRFLQGLIQLAAAWHHVGRGNLRGAERLLAAGLDKLAPYGAGHFGVERAACEEEARILLATLEAGAPVGERPPPRLSLTA